MYVSFFRMLILLFINVFILDFWVQAQSVFVDNYQCAANTQKVNDSHFNQQNYLNTENVPNWAMKTKISDDDLLKKSDEYIQRGINNNKIFLEISGPDFISKNGYEYYTNRFLLSAALGFRPIWNDMDVYLMPDVGYELVYINQYFSFEGNIGLALNILKINVPQGEGSTSMQMINIDESVAYAAIGLNYLDIRNGFTLKLKLNYAIGLFGYETLVDSVIPSLVVGFQY